MAILFRGYNPARWYHILFLGFMIIGLIIFHVWSKTNDTDSEGQISLNWISLNWLWITAGLIFLVSLAMGRYIKHKLINCLQTLQERAIITISPDQYCNFIKSLDEFSYLMALVMVLVFALVFVIPQISVWYFSGQDMSDVASLVLADTTTVSIGIIILVNVILFLVIIWSTYLVGWYFGRAIAYNIFMTVLTSHTWQLIPGHPDGAAGLKPIGTFFRSQSFWAVIPLLWLAIWWVLIE